MRYLEGIINFSIRSNKGDGRLEGYTNNDWVGSIDDSNNITSIAFTW